MKLGVWVVLVVGCTAENKTVITTIDASIVADADAVVDGTVADSASIDARAIDAAAVDAAPGVDARLCLADYETCTSDGQCCNGAICGIAFDGRTYKQCDPMAGKAGFACKPGANCDDGLSCTEPMGFRYCQACGRRGLACCAPGSRIVAPDVPGISGWIGGCYDNGCCIAPDDGTRGVGCIGSSPGQCF